MGVEAGPQQKDPEVQVDNGHLGAAVRHSDKGWGPGATWSRLRGCMAFTMKKYRVEFVGMKWICSGCCWRLRAGLFYVAQECVRRGRDHFQQVRAQQVMRKSVSAGNLCILCL